MLCYIIISRFELLGNKNSYFFSVIEMEHNRDQFGKTDNSHSFIFLAQVFVFLFSFFIDNIQAQILDIVLV
jgi:hypothetical protein